MLNNRLACFYYFLYSFGEITIQINIVVFNVRQSIQVN